MTAKCSLPPDPDGMNEERALWADACIDLMSTQTGCEPGQEALGDLLCNIFHWGDRHGFSNDEIKAIFDSRFRLYKEETAPLPED